MAMVLTKQTQDIFVPPPRWSKQICFPQESPFQQSDFLKKKARIILETPRWSPDIVPFLKTKKFINI
jgi:hypothetical protein